MRNIANIIQKMICAKVKEIYMYYKSQGKEIYAQIIRESTPECFEG